MPTNPNKFKKEQRKAWDLQAQSFDSGYLALLRPATRRLIDAARVSEDDRVLDLACGTGMQSFMVSRGLGARGERVGIDLSPGLIEVARSKAASLGLANTRFEVMDAEELELEDHSFDVVISQWGLFLFPDPEGALKEVRRVLRPGGRVAFSVTGDAEHCEFLTLPARVATQLGVLEPPAADEPNNFRYPTPAAMSDVLANAGFLRPRSVAYDLQIRVPSADVYWELFSACSGPFQVRLNQLGQDQRARLVEEVKRSVRAMATPDGVRMGIRVIVGAAWAPGAPRRRAPIDLAERTIEDTVPLSPDDVNAMRTLGALIIDIRQPEERRSTMPGSLHIPRGMLESEIERLVSDPSVPIIVFSETGRRGTLASASLRGMGYRVANLDGGFRRWSEAEGVDA